MYEYRRYLGKPTSIAGHDVKERTVFGFSPNAFVLPGVAYPIAASEDDIEKLTRQSRPFKADPSSLFNFTEAPVKEDKVTEDKTPKRPKVKVTDKPTKEEVPKKINEIKPSEILKDVEVHKTEKPVTLLDDDTYDTEVPENVLTRISAQLDHTGYHKKDIRFNSGILMGGTASNYKTVKLTPFGGTSLQIEPVSANPKYRPDGVQVVSAPDYVMQDFIDNVSHALGLKVPLPFQRLAFGYTNEGTMIVTRVIQAQMYGIILVDGKQIERLMGGFNSRTMAQAITHELAHFIDKTMLRNVERMKWQEALRGKNLHPDQGSMGAQTTGLEHFATLAELMVWGNSLRRVYNLNGIEIVGKYFLNRYISDEIIKENMA